MRVALKGMSADIDAEHGLLFGKPFVGVQFGDIGVIDIRIILFDNVAEQAHLHTLFLLCDLVCTVEHALVNRQKLRTLHVETVERARRDQSFHHAFVYKRRTAEHEIGEIFKLAVRIALVDDLLRRGDADAFQGAQPEAYAVALHREIRLALVDVGL